MLQKIDIPDLMDAPPTPPPRVSELLEVACQRIDNFIHRKGRMIHGFVASDYLAAYAALQWIETNRLLSGHAFCEWGCGFGIVTMLASLIGMDACGIEVEPELVDRAEMLSEELEIPCSFSVGSLIPDGADQLLEFVEDVSHIDTDSPDGYGDLGLEVDDFDLFYVYPWPGEERYLEDIFDHYAAEGSMLLSFHGVEDLRLQRKVSGRRRRQ